MPNKIASFGKEWSFTYLAALEEFPNETIVSFGDFGGLVGSVISGDCSSGIAPFYNSHKFGIHDAQTALRAQKGKIFISGLVAKRIRHVLCGFGDPDTVKQIRTKNVVFEQCSKCLSRLDKDVEYDEESFSDTASAIESLKDLGDSDREEIAAIGSREAANHYQVPIIQDDFENPRNVTLFWKLSRTDPTPFDSKRVLVLISEADEEKLNEINKIILDQGLRQSCAWRLTNSNEHFMEISSVYDNLALHSICESLTTREDVILVGGYDDGVRQALFSALEADSNPISNS